MSGTRTDARLFSTLPFKALIARCSGNISAPSLVVIITAAVKRSAVWLAFQVVFLSENGPWRRQPPLTLRDAHVKATTRPACLLETNLVCLSPSSSLAEPLPSSAGRDYSAGGARDGAGKSLFIKAEGIGACCELSAAFITLHGFV